MTSTLEVLLVQLRDGVADPAVLARARALVSGDERIPADLREIVLVDPAEAADDAVGLLAVLGVDDLGAQIADAVRAEASPNLGLEVEVEDGWAEIGDVLREGLLAEAGTVEVASAVMRRVPIVDFAWGPVVAEAVQDEAGAPDLTDRVLAEVGARPSRTPVADAIRAEAGGVDLADAVLATLGLAQPPVREAILAESGSPVDLTDGILERIAAIEAGRAASRAATRAATPLPSALPAVAPRMPVPANNVRRFGMGALALAAVALISVVVGRLAVPTGPDADDSMLFAQAGDVVIEDLSSANDVSVTQLEGDDGAVILWIDEEAG